MCNAWNHPPGCTCGWGGEGHLGHSYGSSYIYTRSSLLPISNWDKRSGFYDSYINKNARCPVCGDPVIFYQSPYGGRVFFDELGWPWPKHPCTDNSLRSVNSLPPSSLRNNDNEAIPEKSCNWQVQGWSPFVCLYQDKDKTKHTEIWGKILAKNPKGQEYAYFIMAYGKALDCKLGDAPILIKEINKKIGEYKLSSFKVSTSASNIEPFEVQLYSAKPLPTNRGTPVCPRCGCEARDLSDHMMRRHRNSTEKQ